MNKGKLILIVRMMVTSRNGWLVIRAALQLSLLLLWLHNTWRALEGTAMRHRVSPQRNRAKVQGWWVVWFSIFKVLGVPTPLAFTGKCYEVPRASRGGPQAGEPEDSDSSSVAFFCQHDLVSTSTKVRGGNSRKGGFLVRKLVFP